ncbi:GATA TRANSCRIPTION FACTOR 2 [Salix koriyanagi]|uniref:GATA transcription factor n=1 Tax=Salix koriyanagi TaxID=2511006 RepID=A0A9Q0Z629_9ROSI|nr:GATA TRANSCRIPTION FACTOR 2 [Salix koriyanagi]
MDVHGGLSTTTAPDCFHIDDLLDFSNDDLLSSPSSSSTDHHLPTPETPSIHHHNLPSFTYINNPSSLSTDFTDHLSVPSHDVAELEWLSQFVEDSFSDFPSIFNIPTDTSSSNNYSSKRSRAAASTSSSPVSETAVTGKPRLKKENSGSPHSLAETEGGVRRCTHCASEKTPQWRTGPLGPKTLCNACGVRYKSGRLVPEYRPAASPTFVLTRHSNSHRKVLELRRQKEVTVRQEQHGYQGHKVC